MTNPANSFPRFSQLPPELRLQIWHAALPLQTLLQRPLVFPCNLGCWAPRRLTPADPDFNADNDELNLNFEFDLTRLDPIKLSTPLLAVTREARDVALTWINKHSHSHSPLPFPIPLPIQQPIIPSPNSPHLQPQPSHIHIQRRFNPALDILYIPTPTWPDFLTEPWERPFEADLVNRTLGVEPVPFSTVVVDEGLVRGDVGCLVEMFEHYYAVEVVFVNLADSRVGEMERTRKNGEEGNDEEDKKDDDCRETAGSGRCTVQVLDDADPGGPPALYWDSQAPRWMRWGENARNSTVLKTHGLLEPLRGVAERLPPVLLDNRRTRFEIRLGRLVNVEV
ncbi:hypothetical protein BJX64DRAFT_166588 [Aspergillus heterothallicus]